jgi:hypothetical protein
MGGLTGRSSPGKVRRVRLWFSAGEVRVHPANLVPVEYKYNWLRRNAAATPALIGVVSVIASTVVASRSAPRWPVALALLCNAVLWLGISSRFLRLQVLVGPSGVVVRNFFRTEFVSWAEVAHIDRVATWQKNTIRIVTTGSRSVDISLFGLSSWFVALGRDHELSRVLALMRALCSEHHQLPT